MSEFYGDVDAVEGALLPPLVSGPRKRGRDDNGSAALDAYPRHTPQRVRVQVVCERGTGFVSLRGHVLDAHGRFNAADFPGLAFFYNPSVASVACGTVTLHLGYTTASAHHVLHDKRHHPCPVHGPFRCPCHTMHQAAEGVAQLLREIFCQDAPFDVSIDCQRPYPHLLIDSQERTWSVGLFGLPLPPAVLGPFPLGNITSPQSIKNYWQQYNTKSRVAEDACAMCGGSTITQCTRCQCRLCPGCGELCSACNGFVCRGCSAECEGGASICYNCAS